MISKAYQKRLKTREVKRFIEDNDRRPTNSELKDLLSTVHQQYSNVDQIGISSYDLVKPKYHRVSSAEVENTNRQALFDDVLTMSERADNLTQLLEDSFRGFQATAKRTKRFMNQIESRLDNLLLLNQDVDDFIYGIEETFDTQEYIDFRNTTASVENGYCTLQRKNYTLIDSSKLKFSVNALSDKGFLSAQSINSLDYLKEEDGSFWEYIVYTSYRQGRVTVLLDIEIDEATYVGELRFTGSFAGVNQRTTMTCMYSLDGQTFDTLRAEVPVSSGAETSILLGIQNIKKIRLAFSKETADRVTHTANQYTWVYSLDNVKLYGDQFTDTATSVLIAGPYEVIDEEGNDVNFTKATLTACVLADDRSSVNFFLSKDGTNWKPISYHEQSLSIISFANGRKDGSVDYIDPTESQYALIDESISNEFEIDFKYDAVLNSHIAEAYIQDVPLTSIKVKRNISTGTETVYAAPTGWIFNQGTNEYQTTIYIDAPEGRRIDFGPKGLYVNGTLLSGVVHLKQGYTALRISTTSWQEVPTGLTTLEAFKAADPLYPYNHKYLVEGYNYVYDFSEERVYPGVDEYFGRLLKYIPPEQFNSSATNTDQSVYTLENIAGIVYFKVKVDKTDSSWKSELFDLDWLVQRGENNLLYVKAELETSSADSTPMLGHFKVRVV